jgi:uncharacterized protein (TIGR03083 family)
VTTRTSPHLVTQTHAERERLVSILDALSPQQWDTPSLCEGWRVREVVAHIVLPFQSTRRSVFFGVIRSGFSFHRYADRAAREMASNLTGRELVARLRDNVTHPWTPPGGGQAGALSHDVIHGLDITEPLHLSGPPAHRIALVLRGCTPRQLRYFGVNLTGQRLIANDADATVGAGPATLHLGAKEILLIVTGRRSAPANGRT